MESISSGSMSLIIRWVKLMKGRFDFNGFFFWGQVQSCLPPTESAKLWLRLQSGMPDKQMISPAAAFCPAKNCCRAISPQYRDIFRWFDKFFMECAGIGCRIDYLAVHYYRWNASPNTLNSKDFYLILIMINYFPAVQFVIPWIFFNGFTIDMGY